MLLKLKAGTLKYISNQNNLTKIVRTKKKGVQIKMQTKEGEII